jgi:hypothetical protein
VVSAAGDGWNGNFLYISPEIAVTLGCSDCSEAVDVLCIPEGTYSPYACGGDYPEEVQWEIQGYGVSGGADASCTPTSGSFTVVVTDAPTFTPSAVPSSNPSVTYQPTVFPTIWFSLVNPEELDGVVVPVSATADATADSSLCIPESTESLVSCNLRSAVEYCTTVVSTEACSVILPAVSIIEISSSLGEIVMDSANAVAIYGQGSIVAPDSSTNRFMAIHSSQNISLFDLELQRFNNGEGGAMYLSGVTKMHLERVRFRGNIAGNGGAIFINISNHVTFSDCLFRDNSASGDGGAMYISDYNYRITVSGSTFRSNSAEGNGGGLFVHQYNDFITMDDTDVVDVTATNRGGGLYVNHFNDHLMLHNTTISGCSANIQGGGIYVFKNNYAMSFKALTIEDCESVTDDGAGVFIHSFNEDFVMERCSILRCNSADKGGGLYSYSNDALRIVDSVIAECNAVVDGGGLYFSTGSYDNVISGCRITSCSAGDDGKSRSIHDVCMHCVYV